MKLLEKLRSSEVFELLCILQLGFGTTFMWTGFDTHSFIVESVLHSVHERHPQQIDRYAGYYGQAVNYLAFTFANFLTPLLLCYVNPKWAIFLGSLCFTIYQLGFLFINSYYFYATTALMGVGFAAFYAGHGCYLTEHSTKKNLSRNSSLAWGIACMSMSVGGVILFIVFQSVTSSGSEEEDDRYRSFSDKEIRMIFGAFSAISLLSNIVFFLLPKKKVNNSVADEIGWKKEKKEILQPIVATLKTFANPNVWLLGPSWVYLGMMTSFMLGAYPTSLIFTECLSKSKTLIPLYAFAVGMGEVSTGIFVTCVSKKCPNFGSVPTAAIGFAVNFIAYCLALISAPRYSTLRPTNDAPLLMDPNFYVALVCGYLMGIGDCTWNTSRSCMIPALIPECRAEGFAVSKIFQSVGSTTVYFLSSIIDLYTHFAILMVSLLLCMGTYAIAAVRAKQKRRKVYSTELPSCGDGLKVPVSEESTTRV